MLASKFKSRSSLMVKFLLNFCKRHSKKKLFFFLESRLGKYCLWDKDMFDMRHARREDDPLST